MDIGKVAGAVFRRGETIWMVADEFGVRMDGLIELPPFSILEDVPKAFEAKFLALRTARPASKTMGTNAGEMMIGPTRVNREAVAIVEALAEQRRLVVSMKSEPPRSDLGRWVAAHMFSPAYLIVGDADPVGVVLPIIPTDRAYA